MFSLNKLAVLHQLTIMPKYYGFVLGIALLMAIPHQGLAQSTWQPTHPSNDPKADHTTNDPNIPAPLPKSGTACSPSSLSAQQLVALCVATPSGYFWRWYDFNIYTCTPELSYRTIEYTRSTDAPCKKANWEITKKVGKAYGEDWIVNNQVYDSEKLDDPPGGTGDPPPLPPGDRPTGRTATASKGDTEGKVVEIPKAEEKKVTKTTTEGGVSRDKRPRKSVSTTKKRIRHPARKTQTERHDDHTGHLIGIGVGIGLGLGRTGRGGSDHREHDRE